MSGQENEEKRLRVGGDVGEVPATVRLGGVFAKKGLIQASGFGCSIKVMERHVVGIEVYYGGGVESSQTQCLLAMAEDFVVWLRYCD